ncbi:cAMP-binding protein [Lunatimonas lonarensis]|uniref:cAMP-binding protein n=1 Tax=Lunatimonas lonarensis TaxID=1232681 RepID=R7ZPJ0_9BACT|nr:Crp/Fnr family transcriptional regulator [Lunatimonas lonarensis]EON76036.1 cAMP-binding protein [Lunatimonas lonarensis]
MESYLIQVIQKSISLTKEEISAVDSAFGLRLKLEKDQLLYPSNSHCKYIFFIEKGIVKHAYLSEKGEIITCDFSMEGQFLTDYGSFTTNRASLYQFQALEELHFYRINLVDLMNLYASHPKIETFGRMIAEQTTERITQMARSLISEKASDRYERLLKEKPDLLQRVPQKYIAAYLGVKPESLSRIRKNYLG